MTARARRTSSSASARSIRGARTSSRRPRAPARPSSSSSATSPSSAASSAPRRSPRSPSRSRPRRKCACAFSRRCARRATSRARPRLTKRGPGTSRARPWCATMRWGGSSRKAPTGCACRPSMPCALPSRARCRWCRDSAPTPRSSRMLPRSSAKRLATCSPRSRTKRMWPHRPWRACSRTWTMTRRRRRSSSPRCSRSATIGSVRCASHPIASRSRPRSTRCGARRSIAPADSGRATSSRRARRTSMAGSRSRKSS